jgi:hypothetical protein
MLGFIKGEEMTNAKIALNGTPTERRLNPIGIAAYVGRGETRPIALAVIIDTYSLRVENVNFFLLKNFRTLTLSKMLIIRYGEILMNSSMKFSMIRRV